MLLMDVKDELKYIRFKQRFANLDAAYAQFKDTLKHDTENNRLMRTALIHTFEFVFELAWKAMKDLLEATQGIEVSGPKDTLQEAYQRKYFSDNGAWAEALKKRNESAHTYDEAVAVEIEKFIRLKFDSVLTQIHEFFKGSLNK